MTVLTPYLSFPSPSSSSSASSEQSSPIPPVHSHLLITDSLTSSADFAVSHLIISHRKKLNGGRVILVDFEAKGYRHWQSISRKLGTTLPIEPSSSTFEYIRPSYLPASSSSSALPPPPPPPPPPYHSPSLFNPSSKSNDSPTLQPLYNLLSTLLTISKEKDEGKQETLVVLDGVGCLVEMGFEEEEVGRFIRGLMGIVRKTPSILITCLHADHLDYPSPTPTHPTPSHSLFKRLIRLGNGYWWRIGKLSTGRSGVVMGEISSHPLLPLPRVLDGNGKERKGTWISRSNPIQYRLSDTGVEVFAKGTGKGFL